MEKELEGLNIDDGRKRRRQICYRLIRFYKSWCINIGWWDITDLEGRRYPFKFFHELDVYRVVSGSTWTFNKYLLIIHRLKNDEDPKLVLLIYSTFWVQDDLPPGFFSKATAKQLDKFVGRFLEFDSKQLDRGLMSYLRVCVEADVKKPLKRKNKIMLHLSKLTYANFRYEKLTLFSFLCGCFGHNNKFCPARLNIKREIMEFGWTISLKVVIRRAITTSSVWLREEGDDRNVFGNHINPIPGFNLEGYHNIDFSNQSGSSSSMDQINMDHDVEDDPLVNVDEKKRPRTEEMVPNVSNFIDSFGALV
ncbi:hypothetical protein Gotri_000848 [Gossypium trilobum]|uniref:Zinc knuckle CX2CX4HX4C domain-containing protein n=1 Tax=Gossypium trilobum TaxID=34281 RepID=A0A7J9FCN0_9ROSI|nr:hypothetical protein [Gossypium trilobum]